MKKKIKMLGIIAMVAIIAFGMIACGDPEEEDNSVPGSIVIDVEGGDAYTGKTLTATYSGDEAIAYQWNLNGEILIGATNKTYTPTKPGSYTVTISAEGYDPKTSAAVSVYDSPNPMAEFVGTWVRTNSELTETVVITGTTFKLTSSLPATGTKEFLNFDIISVEALSAVPTFHPQTNEAVPTGFSTWYKITYNASTVDGLGYYTNTVDTYGGRWDTKTPSVFYLVFNGNKSRFARTNQSDFFRDPQYIKQ